MGDESEPAAMDEDKAESDIESDFELDDDIKQSLDCLLKIPLESGEDTSEEEDNRDHGGERAPRLEKAREDSVERNLEALFVDEKERREVHKDLIGGKDTGLESISENEFDGPESGECDTSDGELPDSPNIVVTLPDSPPRLASRESFIPGLDKVSADEESEIELVEEYQNRRPEYYDIANHRTTPTKPDREVVIGNLYDDKLGKGKDKKEKEHKKDRSPEKKNKDKKGKKKTPNDKVELKRKIKLKKYLARLDQYRAKCLDYMSQISEKCDILKKDENKKIKLEKSRIKSMMPSERVRSVVEKINRHKESSPISSSHSSHSSKFGKYSKEDISTKHIILDKAKKSKTKKSKSSSSKEEKEHKLKYHKYIQYLQAEREKCYEDSKVLDKHKHKSNQRKHEVLKSSSSEKLKERQLPFNRPPVMSFTEFCSSRELISPDRESPKKQVGQQHVRCNYENNSKKERTTSIDSEATTATIRSEPPVEEEKDLFVTFSELVEKDRQSKLSEEKENTEKENDPEMKSISVFTSVLFKGSTDSSAIPFIQEDKPPSPRVTEPVKSRPLYTPSNDLDELYDCNDDFSSISQSSFSPSHSPVPKVHNKALLNFVENQKERLESRHDRVPEKSIFKSFRSRSRSPRKDVPRTRKLKAKHQSSISISPSPPSLRPRSPESYKRKKSPLSHLKDRWRDYPSPTERRKEYYDKPPRIHKRSRSRTRVRSGHRSRSSSEERYYRHYHSHSHSRSRSRSPPLLSPAMVQISAAEKRRRLKDEHERALASLRATLRKPTPLSTPLSITFKTDGSSDNYDPVVMNEDSSSMSPGELTPGEVQVPALPPLPPGLPPEPPPAPTNDKTTYTPFPNSNPNLVQTLNYVNNEMTPFNNWMAPNLGEVGSSMAHLYPPSQVLNNFEQFNTPPPQPFPFLNQPPPPLPYQIQVPTPCHQHYRMANQCPPQNINMIKVHQEIKGVPHTPLVTQMPESTDYVLNNTLEASKCKHNLLGHNNQTVQEAIDSVKNCLKNCDGTKNKDPRLSSVDSRSKSPDNVDSSNSSRKSKGQSEKVKITLSFRPRPVSTVKEVCVFDQETEDVEVADIETGVRANNEYQMEKNFNFTSTKGSTEKGYDIRETNTFNMKDTFRHQKPILNSDAEPYDPFDNHEDDVEEIKSAADVSKRTECLRDTTGNIRSSKSDTTAYLSNVEIDNINRNIGKSFAFIFSHTIERKRLTPTSTAIAAKKRESKIKKKHDLNLNLKPLDVKENTDKKTASDELVSKIVSEECSSVQTKEFEEMNINGEISSLDRTKNSLSTNITKNQSPESDLSFVSTNDSPAKLNEKNQIARNIFEQNKNVCTKLQNTHSGNGKVLENQVKSTHFSEDTVLKEIESTTPTTDKTNNDSSDQLELPAQPRDQNYQVNNDLKEAHVDLSRSCSDSLNLVIENKSTISSVTHEKLLIENKSRGIIERRGIPSLSIPTKGELKRFPTPERSVPNSSKPGTLNENSSSCEVMGKSESGSSKHINKSKEKDVLFHPKSVVDSIIDDFEDSNSAGSDSQEVKKIKNKIHRDKLKNDTFTSNEESKTSRFIKLNETRSAPELLKEELKINQELKTTNEENCRSQRNLMKDNEMIITQNHRRKDHQARSVVKLDPINNVESIIDKNKNTKSKLKIDQAEGEIADIETKSPISPLNQEKFDDTILDKKAKSCPLSKKNNSYISQNLPTSFDLTIDGHLIRKGFKKLQVKVKKIKEVSNDSFTDQDESLSSFEDDKSSLHGSKADDSEPVLLSSNEGNNRNNFKTSPNPIKLKKRVSFNMNVSEITDVDPRPKETNLTQNSKMQNTEEIQMDMINNTTEVNNEEKENNTTTSLLLNPSDVHISENVVQAKQNEIAQTKNLSDKTSAPIDTHTFDFSTYYRNIKDTLYVFNTRPLKMQQRKSVDLSIPKPEDMQEAKIKEASKKGLNFKSNKKSCNVGKTDDCLIADSYENAKGDTKNQHLEKKYLRQKSYTEDATSDEPDTSFSKYYKIRNEKEVEKRKKQEKEADTEDSSFLDRELSDLAKGCLDSDEDSILNFGIVPSDESSDDSDFNLKWKPGALRTSPRQKTKTVSSQNMKKRFLKKSTPIDNSRKNNDNVSMVTEHQRKDRSSHQEINIPTSKSSDPDKDEREELTEELNNKNQIKGNEQKLYQARNNADTSLVSLNNTSQVLDSIKCDVKEIPNIDTSVQLTESHSETDFQSSAPLASQKIQNEIEISKTSTIASLGQKCDKNVEEILLSTEQVLKNQSVIVEKVSTEIENIKKDEHHEKALDGTGILYGSAGENLEDSNTSTLRKVRKLKIPKKLSQKEDAKFETNPNITTIGSTDAESQRISVNEQDEVLNSIETNVDVPNSFEGKMEEMSTIQDQQLETLCRRTSKRKCVEKKQIDNKCSDLVENRTNFETVTKRTRSRNKVKEDNFTTINDSSELQNHSLESCELSEDVGLKRTSKLRNVRKGRKNYNEVNLLESPVKQEQQIIQGKKCFGRGKVTNKSEVQLNTKNHSCSNHDEVASVENSNCETDSKFNKSISDINDTNSKNEMQGINEDSGKTCDKVSSLLSVRRTRSSARLKCELNASTDIKDTQDHIQKNESVENNCIESDSKSLLPLNNVDCLNFPKDEKVHKKEHNKELKSINIEGKIDVFVNETNNSENMFKGDESKPEIDLKFVESVLDQGNQNQNTKDKIKTCVAGNTSENSNNAQNTGGKSDDHSEVNSTGNSNSPNESSDINTFVKRNSSDSFESNINEISKPNSSYDNHSLTIIPINLSGKNLEPPAGTTTISLQAESRNVSVNPKLKEALRKKRDKAEVDAEIKRRLAEIDELEKLARTQHASLLGKIGTRTRSKVDLTNPEKPHEEEEDDIVSISSEDSNTTSVDTSETRLSVATIGEPSKTEESTNDEPTTTLEEQTNKLRITEPSLKHKAYLLELGPSSSKPIAKQGIENCPENPLMPSKTNIISNPHLSDPQQAVDFTAVNKSSNSQYSDGKDKMAKRKRVTLETSDFNLSTNSIQLINEPIKRARRNVASVYQFRDEDNDLESNQNTYRKFQSNRSVRNRQLPTLHGKKVGIPINTLRKTSPVNREKAKSSLKSENTKNLLPEPDSSTSSLANLDCQSKNVVEQVRPSIRLIENKSEEDHAVESSEVYLHNSSQDHITSESSNSEIFRQPFRKSSITRKRRRRRTFYNKLVSLSTEQLNSACNEENHDDIIVSVDEQNEEVVSSSVTNIPNNKLSQMKKRRKRKTCVDLLMEDSMLSVARDFPMSPNPYMLSTTCKEIDSNTSKPVLKDICTEAVLPKKSLEHHELVPKPDVLAQKLRLLEKLKCVNRRNRKTRQCRTLVCYNEDSLPESLVESPVSESAANQNETSASQDSGVNETNEKDEIMSDISPMDNIKGIKERSLRQNNKKTPKIVLKKKRNKISSKRKIQGLQKKNKDSLTNLGETNIKDHFEAIEIEGGKEESSSENEHSKELTNSKGKIDDKTSLNQDEINQKDEPSEFDKLLQSTNTSHLRYNSQLTSPRSQDEDKSNDAYDHFFDSFPSPLHSESDYESSEEILKNNDSVKSADPPMIKPLLNIDPPHTNNTSSMPIKILCSILKSRIGKMLPNFGSTSSDDDCDEDLPLSVKLSRSKKNPTLNRENSTNLKLEHEVTNQLNLPNCQAKTRLKGRLLDIGSQEKSCEKKITKSGTSYDEKEINPNSYSGCIDTNPESNLMNETGKSFLNEPTTLKGTRKAKSLKFSYSENDRSETVLLEGEPSNDILLNKSADELCNNYLENNISSKRRGRPAKTKAALKENVSEEPRTKPQSNANAFVKERLPKEAQENDGSLIDNIESMQLRKRKGRNMKTLPDKGLNSILYSEQVITDKIVENNLKGTDCDENELLENPSLKVFQPNMVVKRNEHIRQNRLKTQKLDSQSNEVGNLSSLEKDEPYEEIPLDKRILDTSVENKTQEDVDQIKSNQNQCVALKCQREKTCNEKMNFDFSNMSNTEIKETECTMELPYDEPPPPLIKPRVRRAKNKKNENVYLDPPSLTTFGMEIQGNELQKPFIDSALPTEIDSVFASRKRGRKPKGPNLDVPEKVLRFENDIGLQIKEPDQMLNITFPSENIAEMNQDEGENVNKQVLKKPCKRSKRKVTKKKVAQHVNSTKKAMNDSSSELECIVYKQKSCDNIENPTLDPVVGSVDQIKMFSNSTASTNKRNSTPNVQNISRLEKDSSSETIPEVHEDFKDNSNEDKIIEDKVVDKELITTENGCHEKPSSENAYTGTPSSSSSNQSLLWNKISDFLNKSTRSVGTQVKIKNMALKGFDTSEPVVSLQSELTLPQVIKTLFEELKTLDSSFSDS